MEHKTLDEQIKQIDIQMKEEINNIIDKYNEIKHKIYMQRIEKKDIIDMFCPLYTPNNEQQILVKIDTSESESEKEMIEVYKKEKEKPSKSSETESKYNKEYYEKKRLERIEHMKKHSEIIKKMRETKKASKEKKLRVNLN